MSRAGHGPGDHPGRPGRNSHTHVPEPVPDDGTPAATASSETVKIRAKDGVGKIVYAVTIMPTVSP